VAAPPDGEEERGADGEHDADAGDGGRADRVLALGEDDAAVERRATRRCASRMGTMVLLPGASVVSIRSFGNSTRSLPSSWTTTFTG